MDFLNMTQIGNLATELDISDGVLGKEALKKNISAKKEKDLLDAVERLTSERPTEKIFKDLLISIAKHLYPNLTIYYTGTSLKKEILC